MSPEKPSPLAAHRSVAEDCRLTILKGATNAVALTSGGRHLLIGCQTLDELRHAGIVPENVEWVLLSHHHRTAFPGANELAALGAKIAVPEAERPLFERASEFWRTETFRVHVYEFHPSRLNPRQDLPVARGLHEYETVEWRGQSVLAIATPGPTSGGMTYLVGARDKAVAYVGDLICGDGRIRDFYSLQGRHIWSEGELMEYHGFGERAADVLSSLNRILELEPDLLIPSCGPIVRSPRKAVEVLSNCLTRCLANYHSVSALRWYFPTAWPEYPVEVEALKARCRPLPAWVIEVSPTTRVLVGQHGEAFVLDCAGDSVEQLLKLQADGRLGPIQHVWVTHYHDDHVGRIRDVQARTGCSVIAHQSMADILRRPEAYWMPCLEPHPVIPARVTHEGESWEWAGLRLTAFRFPGQTLFDAALLAERDGQRVLFVGDSLTPGGLDDYCAGNRNFLGTGRGYEYCIALLEKLGPDVLLVNQHVNGAFTFTPEDLRRIRETLRQRYALFKELLDWDDPNFGLDPQWVRADPYYSVAQGGTTMAWRLVICNHSPSSRTYTVTLRLAEGWRPIIGAGRVCLKPRAEGVVHLSARAPECFAVGRYVHGFDVAIDNRRVGEIAEAVVDVR